MKPTLNLAVMMLMTETSLHYENMSPELNDVYNSLTQDDQDEFDVVRYELTNIAA